MTDWYKSEAAHEPLLIDCNSSPTTVFLRRNVKKVTREMDGMTYEAWEYEECKMSHNEYENYLTAMLMQSTAQIEDAVCELSEITEDSIAALEQAICDLSEEIGG